MKLARSREAAAARADYARATMRTAAAIADPKASPMDRYKAAAAEEAACKAARQAGAERDLEAGE